MLKIFLHIIRWPNLAMVALIQYLIYLRLLSSDHSLMALNDFICLCLITILIAASGYVINDYYDSDIDSVNRPDRWIAGNTWSKEKVRYAYYVLVASGGLLSIFLGWKLSLIAYVFIYPVAILGLWLYSYRLKCIPVAGNVWVSLFCAGVVVIVALPDWLLSNAEVISVHLWYYTSFAFLTTWYREVIKDLEDVTGDTHASCQTLVVRYGIKTGKIVAIMLGVSLMAALYTWDLLDSGSTLRLFFTILQGAVIASMAFIWWASDRTFFRYASLVVKMVMVAGTSILLMI